MSAQHVQDLTGHLLALLSVHQAAGKRPTDEQISAINRLSGIACCAIIQAMTAAWRANSEAVH
jgi:hypothetical protein